jgi:pyridoxamine 5'-phosphate oxidase
LAALASRQSEVIPDRKGLEERFKQLAEQYKDEEIPLPSDWGGYRLFPNMIEFWSGRPNRLHDRFRYTRQPNNDWRVERISP